jgi:hypothetical protein
MIAQKITLNAVDVLGVGRKLYLETVLRSHYMTSLIIKICVFGLKLKRVILLTNY